MEYIQNFYITAAAVCLGAVICRTVGLFRLPVGSVRSDFSFKARVGGVLAGAFAILGSPARILSIIRSLVQDVLFQMPILARSPLSWLMHLFIFWGFSGLLVFHALESWTSEALFDGYAATLNPYICLRNIMGVLVLLGLAIAVYRRKTNARLRQVTKRGDYAAIVLLAMIVGSGFLVEAGKIISQPVFDEMVDEWGVMVEQEELPLLETYWQQAFNVYFKDGPLEVTPERMAQGESIHEDNCAECHTAPQWAFVSYPLSCAMGPAAYFLNRHRADKILLVLHILCCITGILYLPFSKLFHILASPLSLLVRGVAAQQVKRPENQETRRALDLSACTRCGACTTHCAVAPVYDLVGNPWLLPLERLDRIRRAAFGRSLAPDAFWEASFLCTGCNTCSMVCPAGLDLQGIWTKVRDELTRNAYPDPVVRKRAEELKPHLDPDGSGIVLRIKPEPGAGDEDLVSSLSGVDFSMCYTCLTCSNSCPVAYDPDFSSGHGTAPHQIIHSLGLGLKEQALGAPLVWDCLTCYLCQENCPQGVKITDVFYGLRQMAFAKGGAQ